MLQLAEFLGEEETVKEYELREPYSSIEVYPPISILGLPDWRASVTVGGTTALALAGKALHLSSCASDWVPAPLKPSYSSGGGHHSPCS